MSTLLFIIPTLLIIAGALIAVRLVKGGLSKKKALMFQIGTAVLVMAICLVTSVKSAYASETKEAQAATSASQSSDSGSKAMAFSVGLVAAALVTGLSGIGGGIAVASSAPAAIAATSENPKAFGKSLIMVVLGEGIALYGLLISMMILTNLGQLGLGA